MTTMTRTAYYACPVGTSNGVILQLALKYLNQFPDFKPVGDITSRIIPTDTQFIVGRGDIVRGRVIITWEGGKVNE